MAQHDCVEPYCYESDTDDMIDEPQSPADPDQYQATWWNRSVGPLVLTILLAPLAWTIMLVVYLFMGIFVVVGMGIKSLQSIWQSLNLSAPEQ